MCNSLNQKGVLIIRAVVHSKRQLLPRRDPDLDREARTNWGRQIDTVRERGSGTVANTVSTLRHRFFKYFLPCWGNLPAKDHTCVFLCRTNRDDEHHCWAGLFPNHTSVLFWPNFQLNCVIVFCLFNSHLLPNNFWVFWLTAAKFERGGKVSSLLSSWQVLEKYWAIRERGETSLIPSLWWLCCDLSCFQKLGHSHTFKTQALG